MSLNQILISPVAGWARFRTLIAGCICADRERTPEAASWERRGITARGRCCGGGARG